MKTDYSDDDILRAFAWYAKHKVHVDRLVKGAHRPFPMSGSDIAHPELWKPGGWKWFLETYPIERRVVLIRN